MVSFPAEWRNKTFDDFIKIKRGASPRPIEDYLVNGSNGVHWIKIGDAPKFGKYITSTAEKISNRGAKHSVFVHPGDFILSNSMSFGRPYIVDIEGCIHDGWLRLFDFQSEATEDYLYYLLSSSYVQKQYTSYAAGSGVQNLNKEVVKKVDVFLPPIYEQKEIAKTLSDFDTYINDLEELIEKKKNIRDGVLEDLLSQKTRLNGYTNQWEIKTIHQIADRYDNFRIPVTANLRKKGKTPYYGANGILDYIDGYTHDGEFVLIAEDGANDLKKYPVNYVNGKVWVNNHAHVLKGKNGVVNTKFLFYALQKVDFESILVGGTRSKLNSRSLMEIELTIPNIREQREIANILENVDNEITCLEKELDKIFQIRDGAMDDLLTGRIRLKD